MVEWTYTGESYLGQEMLPDYDWPNDIFFDGTYWWVAGAFYSRIYKYDSNWNYTGVSYYVGNEDTYPWSIHFDGVNWWMLGAYNYNVYKYDSNWNYLGVNYYLGTEENRGRLPSDIFFDGTYWWLLGRFNLPGYPFYVFKYDSNWNYLGVREDADIPRTTGRIYVSSEDADPWSIHFDGTYWWMAGQKNNRVYKYDSNWNYTGVSYYVGNEETPAKIHFDGTNWWMLDNTYGKVYKYTGPPPPPTPQGFLKIIGITAPTSAHEGDLINFTVHTKNTGAADNFKVELSGYLTGSKEFSLGAKVEKCIGPVTPCSSFNDDEDACEHQQGCEWSEDDICVGTATPCSSFTIPIDCMIQYGCIWEEQRKDVIFSFTMPNHNVSIIVNTYHWEGEAVGWALDVASVWNVNNFN